MQYHAIPCHTMQYHAILCNTMQCHAIPCNTMQCHAIPCNTMQYHAIPGNTMHHQNYVQAFTLYLRSSSGFVRSALCSETALLNFFRNCNSCVSAVLTKEFH